MTKGRNNKDGRYWKSEVLKRDNYKCRHCESDKNLCSHHIIEWDKDESLRYEISNGLTLCRGCHNKIHFKGKKLTAEHKAKCSASLKLIIHTPEWNANMGDSKKGKKLSEVRKAQMSALMKGKESPNKGKKTGKPSWNSGKTYKRFGVSPLKGRKVSDEHREKLKNILQEVSQRKEVREANSLRTKGKKWIIDPETNKRKWILD